MISFELLLDEIGHFGIAQIVIFLMLSYYRSFAAFHSLATVFIAYEPTFRCNLPELEHVLNMTESDKMKEISPYDSLASKYTGCYYYPYNIEECKRNVTNCINKTSEPIQCNSGYIYDKSVFTETVISEFDLVCDQYYLNSIAISIYQVGNFVGSITFGNFSDRYGRKVTCVITFLLALGCSFGVSYSSSMTAYIIFRGMTAVFAYGTAIGTYVYVTEIVGPKQRAYVSIGHHIFYPVGYIFQSLLAYYWRDWHDLMLICTIVSLPLLFFCVLVPESPRWLLSTGKEKKGKKVVELMARINGKTLSEDVWAKATKDDTNSPQIGKKKQTTYTTLDLFKRPNMRKMTLNVMFQWFAMNLIYYGISLNTEALAGDLFVNNSLNGIMEILAYIFTITLITKVGRRISLYGGLIMSSVGLLCSSIILENSADNESLKTLSVVFAMVGKVGSSICNAGIYTVTVELFPTVLRSNGLGIGSASSRVGGTLAAFIIALQKYIRWLPNLILGLLGAVAAAAAFFLPETKGCGMLDNIDEAEEFLCKKKPPPQETSEIKVVAKMNEINENQI